MLVVSTARELPEDHVHGVNPIMAHGCNIWEMIRCFRDDVNWHQQSGWRPQRMASRENKTKNIGIIMFYDGKYM